MIGFVDIYFSMCRKIPLPCRTPLFLSKSAELYQKLGKLVGPSPNPTLFKIPLCFYKILGSVHITIMTFVLNGARFQYILMKPIDFQLGGNSFCQDFSFFFYPNNSVAQYNMLGIKNRETLVEQKNKQ